MKIITYILLALVLAVSGLAGVYYVKAGRQEASMVVLKDTLDKTVQSLNGIKGSIGASDKSIKELTTALGKVDDKDAVVTERVVMLEKSNAEIRDFLSTPLPADGCLLDDSCDAVSLHQPERSPVDSLRQTPHPQKR